MRTGIPGVQESQPLRAEWEDENRQARACRGVLLETRRKHGPGAMRSVGDAEDARDAEGATDATGPLLDDCLGPLLPLIPCAPRARMRRGTVQGAVRAIGEQRANVCSMKLCGLLSGALHRSPARSPRWHRG